MKTIDLPNSPLDTLYYADDRPNKVRYYYYSTSNTIIVLKRRAKKKTCGKLLDSYELDFGNSKSNDLLGLAYVEWEVMSRQSALNSKLRYHIGISETWHEKMTLELSNLIIEYMDSKGMYDLSYYRRRQKIMDMIENMIMLERLK